MSGLAPIEGVRRDAGGGRRPPGATRPDPARVPVLPSPVLPSPVLPKEEFFGIGSWGSFWPPDKIPKLAGEQAVHGRLDRRLRLGRDRPRRSPRRGSGPHPEPDTQSQPGTRRQAFEGEAALLRSSILWRPGRPRPARLRQGTRVPRTGRFTFRGGETGRLCHGWGSSSSQGNIPAARLRLPSPGWRPGFRSSRTSESSEAYSGTHTFYGKFRLHIDRRSTENIIYGGGEKASPFRFPGEPKCITGRFGSSPEALALRPSE